MTGKIFVISAPSGAGKTSLVAAAINYLQGCVPIRQVATYTTRKPRKNEQQGRDYNFIDIADFRRRIQEDFFLEWSDSYTAYYGSPARVTQEAKEGKSSILILDRAGARAVKERISNAILIWIEVPLEIVRQRLLQRATENLSTIERRLRQSQIEIVSEQKQPLYHYTIVNDIFEVAVAQLITIIEKELAVFVITDKLVEVPHEID